VLEDVLDKPPAAPLSPVLLVRGDILQFADAVAFVRHDADAHRIRVIENKHIPAVEVGIDHGFLFIAFEQQVKKPSPVTPDLFNLHGKPGYMIVRNTG